MKTYIAILVFGLVSFSGFAHQSEMSSTVLAKNDNNVWALQISASLTAFQQEINTHFSDTPYQTPEEFREMVIAHVKNNLQMYFDNNVQVTLKNGMVRLGHETKVIFEVDGIPENFQTMSVTNTTFKDIHKSKSLLVVLKDGIDQNKYMLDESNDHSAFLACYRYYASPSSSNRSDGFYVLLASSCCIIGINRRGYFGISI